MQTAVFEAKAVRFGTYACGKTHGSAAAAVRAGAHRASSFQSKAVFQSKPRNGSSRAQTVLVRAEDADTDYSVFSLSYDIANASDELTKDWKPTINVAVSGAAGQISNHLLFMLASGEVYGKDQPINLKMLGSTGSYEALQGVAMELEDSLYPLLRSVSIGISAEEIFEDADWALLIGAKPRGPGMERSDLLEMNGSIFSAQGKALDKVAKKDVKVMVVGNPCNTNALICQKNAPSLDPKNFHALTRLDENRAKSQLALKAGVFYTEVSNVAIWGNHSTTQVPDYVNAKIGGAPAADVIDDLEWCQETMTPLVATRGGALIKKWGRSSAASTAVSIADAIRALVVPTAEGDCFSTAVITDGNPYSDYIPEGLVFSMPARSNGDGSYEIIDNFVIDEWLEKKIAASAEELSKEKDCVKHLFGEYGGACEVNSDKDTSLPGEVQDEL